MFSGQLVVRPHNGTFKQAPYAFYAVGVNVSAYPFFCRMIDRFMAGVGISYSPVVPILIRINRLARRVSRFRNKFTKLKSIAVRNDFQSDFSAALNRSNNCSLVVSMATSPLTAKASADERLINLNDSLQLFCGHLAHRGADTVAKKPSGLVCDSQRSLDLARRNTLFRFNHEIDRQKPFPKRQVCVVKNRVARYRELVSANVAVVLAAFRKDGHAFPFAARTLHAIRPAQIVQISTALFVAAESLNKVHQIDVRFNRRFAF